MNRLTGRLGWLRRWLERVGGGKSYEQPIRLLVSRPDEDDDEEDEGLGVRVPVGPRPLRDGAQAKPPHERTPG